MQEQQALDPTASRRGHARRIVVAGTLAVAIAAGLQAVSPTPATAGMTAQSAATAGALPGSFADLVAAVKPAVVNISALKPVPAMAGPGEQFRFPEGSPLERFFREFNLPGRPGMPGPGTPGGPQAQAAGSGFVIDAEGLIVTNHHVVADANEVMVTFDDGRRVEAEVVGFDEKTDVALLRVATEEPLATVELGDSADARVGDWVVAVGNPFGLGGTVTAGIISARGRDIRHGPYDDYLQIDAPINRGNSGGPLFDRAGRVVGVNTAIFSPSGGSVGIGFAIPSNMVQEIVAELRDSGRVERGWLGVQIQPVTEAVAESLGLEEAQGALVADVMAEGPAAAAGLEPGDVIVSFDGKAVEAFRELPRLVAATDPGDEAKLRVIRGGEERTFEVDIASMPGQPERLASAGEKAEPESTPRLGVRLAPLTDEVRSHLGLEDGAGVVVAGVEPGSAAASRGLEAGDVILRVGRDEVDAPEQVAEAVREAAEAEHESVLLLVRRDDNVRYVAVPLPKA